MGSGLQRSAQQGGGARGAARAGGEGDTGGVLVGGTLALVRAVGEVAARHVGGSVVGAVEPDSPSGDPQRDAGGCAQGRRQAVTAAAVADEELPCGALEFGVTAGPV